jgi:hypothetical protein
VATVASASDRRTLPEEEHELLRASFRQFVEKEMAPTTSSGSIPQDRLSIAMSGVAAARAALAMTLAYVKERTAFGEPIGSFQHSRFTLAELATEIEIGQTFVDRCVLRSTTGG